MAKQTINLGTGVNAGDGDPLRIAFDKINDNFDELYAATATDLTNLGSAIVPDTDGAYDLGSASKQWQDLYVRDFIYLGGVKLEVDAQNNLVVSGGKLNVQDLQGDIFADDSTKVFDSATRTFSGNFDGDLNGSLSTDDSTVIIDGLTGRVTPVTFQPPMLSQAQIDALVPELGMMVYNTTTGKFQGYAADANNDSVTGWADLH